MLVLLGKLERVDLRSVWDHEARSFTPWLAKDENLRLLGETLGIELALEGTEQRVGPFSADIVCKEVGSNDHWILVENQIEQTDHRHLGQLITYAAGLHTATICWVAQRFQEEHRAALDWLNEVTNPSVSFFGLEVELWRIGDSLPAPKFNVISKPNNFVKSLNPARNEPDPKGEFYREYWTAFRDYIGDNSPVRPLAPSSQYWQDMATLHTGCRLRAYASMRDKFNMVDLVVYNDPDKRYFDQLILHKDAVDAQIPGLNWRRKDEYKESAIELKRRGPDPNNRADWENQFAWLQSQLEVMHRVFQPLLKQLT